MIRKNLRGIAATLLLACSAASAVAGGVSPPPVGVAGGAASYSDTRIVGAVQASGGLADLTMVLGRTLDARAQDTIKIIDAPYLAKCDGATDDSAAISAAINAAIAAVKDVEFPAGRTCRTSALAFDMTAAATRGIHIRGAGARSTVWDTTLATTGNVIQFYSTKDWYSFGITGVQIVGNTTGRLVTIGKDDLSDPLNNGVFADMMVANGNASTANTQETLHLNHVVNTPFFGDIANAYSNGSGTNYGLPLVCWQCDFVSFVNGSYGNGHYGPYFTHGYSYSDTFYNVDVENVDVGWKADSNNVSLIKVINGQTSLWTQFAVQSSSTAGNGVFDFDNNNFTTTSNLFDPANLSGTLIHDQAPVSTPTMPASGATVTNLTGKRVLVTWWGGNAGAVYVNGFGIGLSSGSVVVQPGQTVGFGTYSSAPSWTWSVAS